MGNLVQDTPQGIQLPNSGLEPLLLGARLWNVTCDMESHPAPSFIFHSLSGLERDSKYSHNQPPLTTLLMESSRKTLAVIKMFLLKEGTSITPKVIKIYGMFNQTFPSFICLSIAGYYIIPILPFFFFFLSAIKLSLTLAVWEFMINQLPNQLLRGVIY